MQLPKTKTKTKTKESTVGVRWIENEKIYPQQDAAADDVLEILAQNRLRRTTHKRSAEILAQMQSGKTATMIAVAEKFIYFCASHKKSFQVFFLCGLTHNSLRDQTYGRVHCDGGTDGREEIGAKLGHLASRSGAKYPGLLANEGVIVRTNSASLKKLKKQLQGCKVDERLIFIDENHLGNNMEGVLDDFLKSLGVRLGEQIHTWDTSLGLTHVVGVSATPYGHALLSDSMGEGIGGEALFRLVYKIPSSNYYGLKQMFEDGRIHDCQPLFYDGGVPTEFLKQTYAEFRKNCRIHGNGQWVVRVKGDEHTYMVNFLSSLGRTVNFRLFNSEKANLSEIQDFFGTEPETPVVAVIKDGLRAGISIPKKHYIRGWIEGKSKKVDVQAQAGAGRSCGYDKADETYPIYANVAALKQARDFFEEVEASLEEHGEARRPLRKVPSGPHSREVKVDPHRKGFIIRPVNKKEFDAAFESTAGLSTSKKKHRKQRVTSSDNVSYDACADLLMGRRRSNNMIGLELNAPPNIKSVKNYVAKSNKKLNVKEWHGSLMSNYNKVLKKYPGKRYFLYEEFTSGMGNLDRRSFLKESSGLRSSK